MVFVARYIPSPRWHKVFTRQMRRMSGNIQREFEEAGMRAGLNRAMDQADPQGSDSGSGFVAPSSVLPNDLPEDTENPLNPYLKTAWRRLAAMELGSFGNPHPPQYRQLEEDELKVLNTMAALIRDGLVEDPLEVDKAAEAYKRELGAEDSRRRAPTGRGHTRTRMTRRRRVLQEFDRFPEDEQNRRTWLASQLKGVRTAEDVEQLTDAIRKMVDTTLKLEDIKDVGMKAVRIRQFLDSMTLYPFPQDERNIRGWLAARLAPLRPPPDAVDLAKGTAEDEFKSLPTTVRELANAFGVTDWKSIQDFLNSTRPFVTRQQERGQNIPPETLPTNQRIPDAAKRLLGEYVDEFGNFVHTLRPEMTPNEVDAAVGLLKVQEKRRQEHLEGGEDEGDVPIAGKSHEKLSQRADQIVGGSRAVLESIRNPEWADTEIEKMYKEQMKEGWKQNVRKMYKICPHDLASLPYDEAKEIEITPYNVKYLSKYVNERGMVLPRRLTGLSQKAQKKLAKAIKTARFLGFMSYTTKLLIVDKDKVRRIQQEQEVLRLEAEKQETEQLTPEELQNLYPEFTHLLTPLEKPTGDGQDMDITHLATAHERDINETLAAHRNRMEELHERRKQFFEGKTDEKKGVFESDKTPSLPAYMAIRMAHRDARKNAAAAQRQLPAST